MRTPCLFAILCVVSSLTFDSAWAGDEVNRWDATAKDQSSYRCLVATQEMFKGDFDFATGPGAGGFCISIRNRAKTGWPLVLVPAHPAGQDEGLCAYFEGRLAFFPDARLKSALRLRASSPKSEHSSMFFGLRNVWDVAPVYQSGPRDFLTLYAQSLDQDSHLKTRPLAESQLAFAASIYPEAQFRETTFEKKSHLRVSQTYSAPGAIQKEAQSLVLQPVAQDPSITFACQKALNTAILKSDYLARINRAISNSQLTREDTQGLWWNCHDHFFDLPATQPILRALQKAELNH